MSTNPLTRRMKSMGAAARTWTGRAALLLLAGSAAAACGDLPSEFERDSDDVPPPEIIDLSRTGGDLPLRADGVSMDTLLAKLPRGASARVVTFTTSRGSFLLSPGNKSLKVRAERSGDPHDRRLVARAVLVSDTTSGHAVVSASVSDFTDYLVVPFVR